MKLTYGIVSPCKDCEFRTAGCHDTCQVYKDYKDRIAELKKKRREIIRQETLLYKTHHRNDYD